MIKMSSVTERVQAGMDWLDEHYPDHVERFDPDNFDIHSNEVCVLAQAAQMDYSDVIWSRDDLPYPRRIELGFLDRKDLEDAWVQAYEQRKAALV